MGQWFAPKAELNKFVLGVAVQPDAAGGASESAAVGPEVACSGVVCAAVQPDAMEGAVGSALGESEVMELKWLHIEERSHDAVTSTRTVRIN